MRVKGAQIEICHLKWFILYELRNTNKICDKMELAIPLSARWGERWNQREKMLFERSIFGIFAPVAVNAKVATVLGSIPASSDTVESEGRQLKQRWITYIEKKSKKTLQSRPPSHRDFMVQKSWKSEQSKISHLGTFNGLKLYVQYEDVKYQVQT